MKWTTDEMEKLYREINARALNDPAFADEIKKNPQKVIEEIAGCEIPEDLGLKFIEKDGGYAQAYVVPSFAEGELNMNELKSVAGGTGGDSSYEVDDASSEQSTGISIALIVSVCLAAASVGPCGGDVCGADAGCVGDVCGGAVCGAEVGCAGEVCGGDVTGVEVGCAGEVCGGDVTGAEVGCAGEVCGGDVTGVEVGCEGNVCGSDITGVEGYCEADVCGGVVCGSDGACSGYVCGEDICGAFGECDVAVSGDSQCGVNS